MPQFFARLTDAQGSYATIKKDGTLGWGNSVHAKAFDNAQDARDKVIEAMEATLSKAQKDFARAVAKGPTESTDYYGRVIKTIPSLDAHTPNWMRSVTKNDKSGKPTIDKARAAQSFRIDSKAVLEDIMGSFETFYARSAKGWLGGPRTKSMWGRFEWRESFTDAQGFPSQAAIDEALKLAAATTGHSILRSRSVFTEVNQNGRAHDDVASGIKSACEARDIESMIVDAAKSRLADMKSQAIEGGPDEPAAKPKSRSRL